MRAPPEPTVAPDIAADPAVEAAFPDYRDRIAVLTGAASGIGLELLLQLVRKGTHVAACDLDPARLDAAVMRARKANPGVRVTAHPVDVAEPTAVARLADEVAAAHATARIHLLFNNAGVVGGGSFVSGSRDEWERTFAVSWFGTYHCTRAFLPMLIAADRSVLVNTASVNALWASLGPGTPHTAYSSAKFAIRGFTESLQVDLHKHAPHVSAVLIMPGHVRTGMPSPPRSWRRALDARFADYRPLTSKQAAEAILAAVSAGRWRVVLGQDAEAIDARVREDPWSAYD